MMHRIFIAAMGTFAALSAHAGCTAQSGADRPRLIELYTSEGCSSCPPAEKWLSTLADKPSDVGLEFHVDYWDNGGWRDPFDSKTYTQRQEKLSRRFNKGQFYTPQVWVDGELWHNWPGGDPPNPAKAAAPTLSVDAVPGDKIKAHVVAGDLGGQHIFVALTENGLSTSVRAGENKGRQLAHDQVVRAFEGPFDKTDVQAELKVPRGTDLSKSSVVAFVQDEASGHVSQVVRLPLNQCSGATR
jgi:hypothetical protein